MEKAEIKHISEYPNDLVEGLSVIKNLFFFFLLINTKAT